MEALKKQMSRLEKDLTAGAAEKQSVIAEASQREAELEAQVARLQTDNTRLTKKLSAAVRCVECSAVQ
jgi:peptidoglycan hydrolase CwlO-like protein